MDEARDLHRSVSAVQRRTGSCVAVRRSAFAANGLEALASRGPSQSHLTLVFHHHQRQPTLVSFEFLQSRTTAMADADVEMDPPVKKEKEDKSGKQRFEVKKV